MSTSPASYGIIRSFLRLPPRTRIYFGLGKCLIMWIGISYLYSIAGIVVASIGIVVTEKLEEKWPADEPIASIKLVPRETDSKQ
jgi:hypothetical protein